VENEFKENEFKEIDLVENEFKEIDLVENEFKENIKTNADEICTKSSDLFDENIICEEDIKIDWNIISNHEQETQEQNIN
jgi:hypothetical protein